MPARHRYALLALLALGIVAPAVAGETPYFRFQNGIGREPGIKPQAPAVSGTFGGFSVRQGRSVSRGPGIPAGGTAPYSWSLHSGPLPDGMAVGSDGVISGVARSAGLRTDLALALVDSEGRAGLTNRFSINVLPLPTLSYRSVKVRPGSEFSLPPSPANLIGSPTFALASGSLPPGLRLDPDGVIRGALPSPIGTGPLVVALTDIDGEPATSTPFSIESSAGQADLAASDLDLKVGQDFFQNLAASGFTVPPTYEVVTGKLPDGVALDRQSGALYGKPEAEGVSVGIVVTATAPDGTLASTDPFTIRVTAARVDNPGALRARLYQAFDRRIASSGLPTGTTWQSTGTALPQGMSVSPDGRVVGVPTRLGTYAGLDATASNGTTALSTGAFSVEVFADSLYVGMGDIRVRLGASVRKLPTLEPAGTAATYTLSGPLPSGLRLDPATGAISGTPTVPGGVSGLRLSAASGDLSGTSSAFGVTVTQGLTATATPLGGTVGTRVEHALTADGLIGTGSWRLVSGTLPEGLSLAANGIIHGTPTRAGSASGLVARVTDASDGTVADTQPFTAQIAASDRMLVTGLSGVYGTRVNRPLALPRPVVRNAVGTPRFAIAGPLPDGLAIDSATGAISSGAGPVTQVGSGAPLEVVATDARPSTAASPTFSIRLVGALGLDGVSTIATRVGDYVDAPVQAKNLIGDPKFSVIYPSGVDALPTGLYLTAGTGRIYGRPTASGTLRGLRLLLTDSGDGETVTSAPFDLEVAPGMIVDGPAGLFGRAGQPFDSGTEFSARNVQGGLAWTLLGSLPAGLEVDPNTGRIFGTPTREVTATDMKFIVRQPETGLRGDSRPFLINVKGPLYVSVGRKPGIRVNEPATVSPEAYNRVGAVSWSLAKGAPPPGMGFDAETGRIYGVPNKLGSFGPIVFRARDSIGQEALSQEVTVQVGDQLRFAQSSSRLDHRILQPLTPFNPFTVTGATGDWAITWQDLPKGIVAAPDGTLSGRFEDTAPFTKFTTATVRDSAGGSLSLNFGFFAYWDKPYLTGYAFAYEKGTRQSVSQAAVGKPMMFSSKNSGFPYYDGILDNARKHYEVAPGGRNPPWAVLDGKTGDVSGIPPSAGEYHVDVVLVDDKDGARSDVHDYVILARDIPVQTPDGIHVLRGRNGYTATDAVFQKYWPQASFTKRPNGWCRSNFGSSPLSGKLITGFNDCSVTLHNFNNTEVGSWDGLWVEATDDSGATYHVDLIVQMAPRLTIRTPDRACTRGDDMSVTAKAVGGLVGTPTYFTRAGSYNPNGPDEGFTFDSATGVLSGKPLANGFRYGYAIGVRDGWDGTVAWTEDFQAERRNPLYFKFSSSTLSRYTGYVETAGGYYSTNGTAPSGETREYTLLSPPESVPPGLVYLPPNASDDRYFAGTYTTPGTYDVRVRLRASCPEGTSVEDGFRFVVAQRVVPSPIADVTAVEGVALTNTASPAPATTYAVAPIRWQLNNGTLPQGLTVDQATGRIVGTPALGTANVYTISLTVYDKTNNARTNDFKVIVKPAPGVIYPDLNVGRVGKRILAAPSPLGATGPLGFALATGSEIPSGRGLDFNASTGEITGTPTQAGRIEGLRVVMTESSGGKSTSNPFALDIAAGIETSIAAELDGRVGQPFLTRATVTGIVGAAIWSLAEGELPDGIELDAATGELRGLPVRKGRFAGIRLAVADTDGGSASTTPFAITVADGTAPDPSLEINCNYAVNGSAMDAGGVAAPTGGSGGAGAMPVDASPVWVPTTEQSCRLGLWDRNFNQAGVYQQFYGSVNLVDTEGRTARTLGADYASVKVIDIETGKAFEVGKREFAYVFQGYVTGTGDFSRRFYAIARLASGGTRTSAPFTLSGSYGKGEPQVDKTTWTWGEVSCLSACPSGVDCEARQLQSCLGVDCPSKWRSCQVSFSKATGSPYKVGSEAGEACANPLGPPDERQCFTDQPVDKLRFEPVWTLTVNGVQGTVYRGPKEAPYVEGSAYIHPTPGWLTSLGIPYTEEPYTAVMPKFVMNRDASGTFSGVTYAAQTVTALIVDRPGVEKLYEAMGRYVPKDLIIVVDGPVVMVAPGDNSPFAKAIDAIPVPANGAIPRGQGPYSTWHCVYSVCAARVKPK